MHPRGLLVATLLMASPAAAGQDYANSRFGYTVELPDGFAPAREADNGDGVTVRSDAGNALLLVFGAYPSESSFRSAAAGGVASDQAEGWNISYRRVGAKAASWSGVKSRRILYSRAIPLCEGAVATVRLEYDAAARTSFDAKVARLAASLRARPCR